MSFSYLYKHPMSGRICHTKKEKSNGRRMIGVNNDAQYPASRHVHKSGEKFQAPGASQVLAHQQLEEKNHAQQTALRFRNSHHRRPVLSEPAHVSTRSTAGAAAKAGDETT
jgi:hypothetical protein